MKSKTIQQEEKTQHGTASFPCSVYEYDAPVDIAEKIYCHYHKEVELLYITEGHATLTVNHRIYAIGKGDFIIIPVSHLHMVIGDTKHAFRFVACVFHPDFIASFGNDIIQQKYNHAIINWNFTYSPVIHNDEILKEQFSLILQRWKSKDDGFELQIKIAILTIFSHLYSLASKAKSETSEMSDYKITVLKSLIRYIQNNYASAISLSSTASHFSVSKGHLCRFFKEMTNMSFTEYLNYYRITKSTELLIRTDLPISTISENVGFNNLSFFDRTFQKYMHETPTGYRRSHILLEADEKRIIF